MSYIDIYVSHPDLPTLEAFAGNFVNHTPIMQGQAAVAEDDSTTPPTLARPAKGDPKLFYTCVRATFDITPLIQSPLTVVDPVTGANVVGVFA